MPQSTPKQLQSDVDLLCLHRYWMWANRLREHFERSLLDGSWRNLVPGQADNVVMQAVMFFTHDPGIFMSHWYGALYVVIEGWQELGLSDSIIDPFLTHSNVALLRRYRNGAFHFQRDYFDARFAHFFEEKTTVEWIRTLNREFGRYFLEKMRVEPPKT